MTGRQGDTLHDLDIVSVGELEPGSEVDISVPGYPLPHVSLGPDLTNAAAPMTNPSKMPQVVMTAPSVAGRFISYWRLSAGERNRNLGACRRRTPRGHDGSEGSIVSVSLRSAQAPRHSPSACSEALKEKTLGRRRSRAPPLAAAAAPALRPARVGAGAAAMAKQCALGA